jgi:tRNA-modifying protein YgfZ
MSSGFSELRGAGLIAVRGEDAIAFLHAQLTSDVAALAPLQTQYSGYCTAKGRVRATFLLWRTHDEVTLQLPETLRAELQATLARYVLRSRVQLSPATDAVRLFGVWGSDAPDVLRRVLGNVPGAAHELLVSGAMRVARVPVDRFIVAVTADEAEPVRRALRSDMPEEPEVAWSRHEIEAGIPAVLRESQDRYVPQMLNFDLIGAVSYTKGCYPGQEIVARMHYLGRLKERMYRIHVPGPHAPVAGDALYSPDFGPEQASGSVLYAAPSDDGFDALAVIQTSSARSGALHWKALEGPAVQLESLPYPVPD